MELNFNLNNLARVKKIRNLLESKLSYFSEHFYQVSNNGFSQIKHCKSIVIIAAKHYQVESKEYPSISKKELSDLLKLQVTALNIQKYKVISKPSIDGFEVKTISIQPKVLERLSQAQIIIPETELLMGIPGFSHELDTPAGKLYVHKGNFAYKSSLMPTFELFCYGAGGVIGKEEAPISTVDYSKKLIEIFFGVPLGYLFSIGILNLFKQQNTLSFHWLYGVPLITVFVTLISFVAIDSYHLSTLENSLKSNREEINVLLKQKALSDQNKNFVETVNSLLSERTITFPVWQVVYIATQQEMLISSLRMNNGIVTLRGNAPMANGVLTNIAKINGVKDTTFEGNVRSVRGREHFTITFSLEVNKHGPL